VKLVAAALLISATAAADVTVPERVPILIGQTAPIALAITEQGRTIEGTIVDVAPVAGVTLKKRRFGPGAAFEIPVHGDATGEHVIAIRVRYWACRAHACWPVDVKVKTIAVVSDM